MILDPVVDFHIVLEGTADDINDAKMSTNRVVDVLDVVVAWEDVADFSLSEEVDAVDLISIIIKVFGCHVHLWLELLADERQKCLALRCKKVDLLVRAFVDMMRHFH